VGIYHHAVYFAKVRCLEAGTAEIIASGEAVASGTNHSSRNNCRKARDFSRVEVCEIFYYFQILTLGTRTLLRNLFRFLS
jgi:hypothetical protein